MGKKQRIKLAKASQATTGTPKVDVKRARKPFNFLGLPREVREEVYEELLIKVLEPKDQLQYDQLLSGNFPYDEYNRNNCLDYFEQDLSESPIP